VFGGEEMTREQSQGGDAHETLVKAIHHYLGNGGDVSASAEELRTTLTEIVHTDLHKDSSDMAWADSSQGLIGALNEKEVADSLAQDGTSVSVSSLEGQSRIMFAVHPT
jgi:hypothetical protein